MVRNDIPKSDISGKKFVSESIRIKRFNAVIMTITLFFNGTDHIG